MDQFLSLKVKVVYADDGEDKAVHGIFERHDEMFVYLRASNGDPLAIGKRGIIAVVPVGDAQ